MKVRRSQVRNFIVKEIKNSVISEQIDTEQLASADLETVFTGRLASVVNVGDEGNQMEFRLVGRVGSGDDAIYLFREDLPEDSQTDISDHYEYVVDVTEGERTWGITKSPRSSRASRENPIVISSRYAQALEKLNSAADQIIGRVAAEGGDAVAFQAGADRAAVPPIESNVTTVSDTVDLIDSAYINQYWSDAPDEIDQGVIENYIAGYHVFTKGYIDGKAVEMGSQTGANNSFTRAFESLTQLDLSNMFSAISSAYGRGVAAGRAAGEEQSATRERDTLQRKLDAINAAWHRVNNAIDPTIEAFNNASLEGIADADEPAIARALLRFAEKADAYLQIAQGNTGRKFGEIEAIRRAGRDMVPPVVPDRSGLWRFRGTVGSQARLDRDPYISLGKKYNRTDAADLWDQLEDELGSRSDPTGGSDAINALSRLSRSAVWQHYNE